jgi:hypothetical protein
MRPRRAVPSISPRPCDDHGYACLEASQSAPQLVARRCAPAAFACAAIAPSSTLAELAGVNSVASW